MRTVKQVSRLTGVSVRTLHHYDAIGLLKPTQVTGAGYRLYDDTALRRLHAILLFRELQFPLKEIGAILDNPEFDPGEALAQQIRLLELRAARLQELISHARALQEKGVLNMDFQAFRSEAMDQYAREVKERWGASPAYRESQERISGKSREELDGMGAKMMDIFARLGGLRGHSPADPEVQALIKELQTFISQHYYHCTDEILQGLGQMYTDDPRMKANIDRAGGEGTAEFARQAIQHCCGN